jgi:hypothetical protein
MAKYNKDVFVYRFDQPNENATVEVGTPHFMEVAYVFSNPLPTQNPLPKRAGDMELASFMTSSWVSFVHDLSPDFKGRMYPSLSFLVREVLMRIFEQARDRNGRTTRKTRRVSSCAVTATSSRTTTGARRALPCESTRPKLFASYLNVHCVYVCSINSVAEEMQV